MEDMLCYVK